MPCCACASAAPIPSGWLASWPGRWAANPSRWVSRGSRTAMRSPRSPSPCRAAGARRKSCVGLTGEGFEVIAAAAHQRKLPRGALEANRFALTVRQVVRRYSRRSASVSRRSRRGGVPNYFGPQRFGRDAGKPRAGVAHGGSRAPGPTARQITGRRGFHAVGGAQRHFQCHRGGAGRAGELEPAVGREMSRTSTAGAVCSRWKRPTRSWSGAAPRSRFIPPPR